MHICFTLSSLAGGGAERVAASLCNTFIEKGHKVSIILVSIDHNNSFYALHPSIDVIPLLKTKKKTKPIKRAKDLKETILSINPDVVISFLPHVIVYTYFALKHTKIPLISSERNDPKQYNFIYKLLLKHIFKHSSGCVFQTNDAMKFYSKHKDNKNKGVIIPNPVFLNTNKRYSSNENHSKRLLSVGRLVTQKNFELLIRAFAIVQKSFPEYRLEIYGDGPLKYSLNKLISDLSLTENVYLQGQSKNWHDTLIDSYGFVSSSDFEGMPNCLEEALCLGAPCVATNCPVGGSEYLINLLGNGILIPVNNIKLMADAITKLIKCEIPPNSIDYSALELTNISEKWLTFIKEKVNSNNK